MSNSGIFAVFIHFFGIFAKKFLQIVDCSFINFISKNRAGLLNCSVRVCWLELMLNFSKFYFFGTKIGAKFAFSADLL